MASTGHGWLAIASATGALCASLGSTAGLYFSVQSASASRSAALKLEAEAQVLATFGQRIEALEQACSARALAVTAPVTNVATAPGSPAANVERLADAVAERIATKREAEETARSDDQVKAFDLGARVLDASISSGYWTERDAAELHALVPRLYGEDLFELHRRLSVAINAGKVRPEVRGGF